VRDPVGPGDVGRRPFDASPRLQLVPAGVHHTNTETERPNSILPWRCVACSGCCLGRPCYRRSVGQPAGSALSWASRSQVGRRMRPIRRSFVLPRPDPPAAGFGRHRRKPFQGASSPVTHVTTSTRHDIPDKPSSCGVKNLRQRLDQCPFMYRFHIAMIGPD
jgi:hypothetical protein